LSSLSGKTINVQQIWKDTTNANREFKLFKSLIRSIRFELNNDLAEGKILLLNSIGKGEGKTFVAINLAYAYAQVSKNVLLIDANFDNNDITTSTKTGLYLEDFLKGPVDDTFLAANNKITYMGNKGGDLSITEISNEQHIRQKLAQLKEIFDIIIIEAPALDTLNGSKEWTLLADKIVTVFEAGKTITRKSAQQIEYLKSQQDKFIGWILNLVSDDQLTDE